MLADPSGMGLWGWGVAPSPGSAAASAPLDSEVGGCPHLEGLAAAPSEWGVGRSCPAAEDGGRTPGP